MGKGRYIAVRTIQTILLLWIVLTFLFFFFRLMPGSYLDIIAFQSGASDETLKALEQKWGLNQPLYIQYIKYVSNLATFDAGTSFQYGQPVWDIVKIRIFNSFILVAPAITVAYLIGFVIGTVGGSNRGSYLEKTSTLGVVTFGTMPDFVIGIILIVIFAGVLNVLPSGSMLSPRVLSSFEGAPWWRPYLTTDFALHYLLPFSTIVLRQIYAPTLVMRTSVVEIMGQDFIKYHRVSGLPKSLLYKHIGRHSLLPLITIYPISMTRAISGLVLVEVVFNWPGIGATLVQGVLFRDFPIVMFVFFITATFVIIANFVVDILYGVIDPRVSIGGDVD